MGDGSLAVGLFNRGEVENKVAANWPDLGLSGKQIVRDLWRQKDLPDATKGAVKVTVPAHGVVLLKFTATK